MNNIQYNQGSGTFGQVLIVGLGIAIGSGAMPMIYEDVGNFQKSHIVVPKSYSANNNSSSYSNYVSIFSGEYNAPIKSLGKASGDFYARLLAKQEPLGDEFEKVLNDNLWDLYES